MAGSTLVLHIVYFLDLVSKRFKFIAQKRPPYEVIIMGVYVMAFVQKMVRMAGGR